MKTFVTSILRLATLGFALISLLGIFWLCDDFFRGYPLFYRDGNGEVYLYFSATGGGLSLLCGGLLALWRRHEHRS